MQGRTPGEQEEEAFPPVAWGQQLLENSPFQSFPFGGGVAPAGFQEQDVILAGS